MLHEAKVAYYAFDVIRFLCHMQHAKCCADVLRGERADFTDFISFLVTLVDEVRGQA